MDRLYEQSASQTQELMAFFSARAEETSFDWNRFDTRTNQFLSDKLVALDRDKAEFCYQVCRALIARRVVEAGTSFGVSTLFLAAAVRDNLQQNGGEGVEFVENPANHLGTMTLPFQGGLEFTVRGD